MSDYQSTTTTSTKKGFKAPPAQLSDHQLSLVSGIAVVVGGLLFGVFMRQSGVFVPALIRAQMKMHDFTMMLAFLSAASTSIICFLLLSIVRPRLLVKVSSEYVYPAYGLLSTVVGGALLGAGMTMSGSCPGTIYIQSGMLVPNAVVVLLGCLLGAFAYGRLHGYMQPTLHQRGSQLLKKSGSLSLLFRKQSAYDWRVALGLAGSLLAFVLFLLVKAPRFVLPSGYWNPAVAGIGIGASNLILPLFAQQTLGSTTSYMSLVALLPESVLQDTSGYFAKFRRGFATYWQLVYMVFSVIGSYWASTLFPTAAIALSESPSLVTPSTLDAFAGGFLMVFGSRIANACTSGHGISGIGMLATNSLVAVAAMFLGGMMVALFY